MRSDFSLKNPLEKAIPNAYHNRMFCFEFSEPADDGHYLCIYVRSSHIIIAKVRIRVNRVRLPILLVVS